MIKYVTFNSQDEYGEHIRPVNTLQDMHKTASYSGEINSVIDNMDRKPHLYYVVINAMGSFEVWGVNGNGDAFPRSGLEHKSLRTDMGTANDYGYKTFEYYAKLFKHHNNKENSPSYGEVVFSHWNDKMERIELIVGIDKTSGSDIIDAIESGSPVAVSMGAKVKYDRCNICDNKAKTRAQYCKHVKDKLGKIIDEDTAKKWSIELGKDILPGTKVFVYNDYPRLFDISRVFIGADRTAHIIGKVASSLDHVYYSVDIADAMGVTDEMVDKIAMPQKRGEMVKEIGGGAEHIDGRVVKALKNKLTSVAKSDSDMPNDVIDDVSSRFPVGAIVSSLLSCGIVPKPREFQRIVLVNMGKESFANDLDGRGAVFRPVDDSTPVEGVPMEAIINAIRSIMPQRSMSPEFLSKRIMLTEKTASLNGSEYVDMPKIASMYNGVIKQANAMTVAKIAPYIKNFAIMSAFLSILEGSRRGTMSVIDTPAKDYEDMLQDTKFSGVMDFSKTSSQIFDKVVAPMMAIKTAADTYSRPTMVKTACIDKKIGLMTRNVNSQLNSLLY